MKERSFRQLSPTGGARRDAANYNKTLWTPEEVEIITDNFVKPGNVEGGFSWYRANLSPGLDHSGPVLEKRQQRKETRLTRPRPPILPTAAEAIAQLRRSIEQLRAERDATTLAINLKLRELTVARWEMAVHLRSRGYSLRQLAKLFGVSPERIRQITLKPAPMSPQPKSMRTAKTKTCVDCGVVISPTSERCRPCSQARIARRIHAWHAGGGKGWPPQYWEPEQAQEQATLG